MPANGGFDCDYTYHHEDAGKTGEVHGKTHLNRNGCQIFEKSKITAVELKTLDGKPATSPSLYVGAEGSNTYNKQGCT